MGRPSLIPFPIENMIEPDTRIQRIASCFGAMLILTGITLNWIHNLQHHEAVSFILLKMSHYFTIVSNCTAAIFFLATAHGNNRLQRFFDRHCFGTALAVYLTFVALIFNFIIAQHWHPHGLRIVASNILHVASPIFMLCYWVLFVAPRGAARWKNILVWAAIPVAYFIYIMLLGPFFRYPYPFFDVNKFGYLRVMLHGLGMIFILLALSTFFILLEKRKVFRKII